MYIHVVFPTLTSVCMFIYSVYAHDHVQFAFHGESMATTVGWVCAELKHPVHCKHVHVYVRNTNIWWISHPSVIQTYHHVLTS